MRRVLLGALLVMSCGVAFAQEPGDIPCPLFDAPAVGLPNLPGGWWTTSGGTNSFLKFAATAGVTATEVVAMGDSRVLVCTYGGVGSLTRVAPSNTKCSPTPAGFACTAG